MAKFKKTCKMKGCGKAFESDARNARYCPDCAKKAGASAPVKPARAPKPKAAPAVKAVKKSAPKLKRVSKTELKARAAREKEYKARAIRVLLTRTMIPCGICGNVVLLKLAVPFAKDGKITNTKPENLVWACQTCKKGKAVAPKKDVPEVKKAEQPASAPVNA